MYVCMYVCMYIYIYSTPPSQNPRPQPLLQVRSSTAEHVKLFHASLASFGLCFLFST